MTTNSKKRITWAELAIEVLFALVVIAGVTTMIYAIGG